MANDEEQSDPFDPTLIDPNYYEGLAQEFISKVGRLNSFTKHPPSVGTYHEEIIRSMLNDILPARFSVKTGFVFVETGAVSRQIDILIIDESQPSSYFFKVGQFAVVHPRAVACAIEVKTKLDKRSFLEAVQNIYQFQLTCEAVVPPAPIVTTIVFAFDSVNLTGQTMDRWYKSIDVPDKVQYYPMFVLALNKGAITLLAKRKPAHWGHYLVIPEESEHLNKLLTSVFLATVRKSTEAIAGVESNPYSLAYLRGYFSTQYCKFGVGFVDPDTSALY